MNQEKVNQLLKAFTEKPIRLTYSYKKLSAQFDLTVDEIKSTKRILIAQKHSTVQTSSFEELLKLLTTPSEKTTSVGEHTVKTDKDGSVEVEIQEDSQIDDPKELLKLVKLNPDEFEVMSFWRGFRRDKWWASVKAKPITGGVDYLKAYRESIEEFPKMSYPIIHHIHNNSDKMAVVCLFDIHFGKLGLWDYTGSSDITASEVIEEFTKLEMFLKKQKVNKILLPIGNDFFNVDDSRISTTYGTPLDNDSNLYRVFKSGLNIIRYMIERLSQLAPVDVVLVAGNHANYTETILATSIAAIFKESTNINVDDSPKDRKYIKFDKVLLGLTHGIEKPEKYAELLPFEAKEYFSSCNHFEILVGDKHHEKVYKNPVIETGGVVVRQLGALTKTDKWHDKKGYTLAKRRSYVLIYDAKQGLELQYTNIANEN